MYCFTSDVESEPDQEAENKGKAEFNQKKMSQEITFFKSEPKKVADI